MKLEGYEVVSSEQQIGEQVKCEDCAGSEFDSDALESISSENTEKIDLFSLMQALQEISGEVSVNGVLSSLMKIMIENMGAQRGFLIRKINSELFVRAYLDQSVNKKEIVSYKSIDNYEEIPKTVIWFTANTGENILFPAKSYMNLFTQDSYIDKRKPKSFFSVAVKLKNEIKGVMFLENNLIEEAFSPDRMKLIEILCAQAAISLENAYLHETLKHNMEDKLRKSEAMLNVTANAAGLGVWDWMVQTGEVVFNEQWAGLLGYTLEELAPLSIQTWVKLTHPEDVDKSNEIQKRCFSKEIDFYECETRMKHKNGSFIWILSRGRVVEWSQQDAPIRMVGVHMDVNQRKKSEAELKSTKESVEEGNALRDKFLKNMYKEVKEAENEIWNISKLPSISGRAKDLERTNLVLEEVNLILHEEIEKFSTTEAELMRAKDEADKANLDQSNFISNVSHELRTPIAVILGGIQLMEANAKNNAVLDKQKLFKNITTIKQNCYRLLRLVNNIIDVTKYDAGFSNLKLKNLDIINLLESITDSVVDYAKLKGITVIFDTDEEERVMAVDPDKMERILLNLLSNAMKFTPKDGFIYINVFNEDSKVIFTVEDTGIGIPPEKKEMIFERFQQLDTTFTRENEGSGIGLSIVKAFAELHGGKISVSSELGKGCKFTVELPAKKLEDDPYAEPSTTNQSTLDLVDMLNIEFSDIYF